MKLVILAAGVGSRLGHGIPKAMIEVASDMTILDLQLSCFQGLISVDDIIVVVGYKKELIMERHPELMYVYNSEYAITNTSKSLLRALKKIKNEDVIFINGDIVFTKQVANYIIKSNQTSFMVNTARTADEEVKYKLDSCGKLVQLSKEVQNANGEAVGINYIAMDDLSEIRSELANISDMDYFEKAFENLLIRNVISIKPLSIEDEFVKEIDFPEDLEIAKQNFKQI